MYVIERDYPLQTAKRERWLLSFLPTNDDDDKQEKKEWRETTNVLFVRRRSLVLNMSLDICVPVSIFCYPLRRSTRPAP